MATSITARAGFALLLSLVAAPALAGSSAEVCVLTVTDTKAPPKKPRITETQLDCGKKPTEQQAIGISLVNNAMNAAEALEIVARLGYEIESGTWREGYTGHQVYGVFVVVKEAGDAAVVIPEEEGLEDAVEPAPAPEPAAEPVTP